MADETKRMTVWAFLREVGRQVIEHHLTDVSAQLAYSSLLALFPFVIFLVTVLGFLPIQHVVDEMLRTISRVMPQGAMSLLEETVRGVVRHQNGKLLAISIAGSTWAASSGIVALTTALNHAYHVRETRSWLRVRAESVVITLASTVLLVIATTALMIGPHVVARATAFFGLDEVVVRFWRLLRWPATIVASSGLLAMLYWVCPDVRRPFRFFTLGSVVAIPLWIGMSQLFNLYVSHLGRFNATYGALGTGVVLLLWIYLTGFIVLVGGEMNAVLERHARQPAGSTPDDGARR